MLTLERIRELLHYDPATGVWTWLVSRGSRAAGTQSRGSLTNKGYLLICVDDKRYLAHRLAWLYMTGAWPEALVDHRDRDGTNNIWLNLRAATYVENGQNTNAVRNLRGDSFRGICQRAPGNWIAYISTRGRRRHLGTFTTPEQASAAYERARALLHPFSQPN